MYLPPIEVSLTLWGRTGVGETGGREASMRRMGQSGKEKMVASTRGGIGDREKWRH